MFIKYLYFSCIVHTLPSFLPINKLISLLELFPLKKLFEVLNCNGHIFLSMPFWFLYKHLQFLNSHLHSFIHCYQLFSFSPLYMFHLHPSIQKDFKPVFKLILLSSQNKIQCVTHCYSTTAKADTNLSHHGPLALQTLTILLPVLPHSKSLSNSCTRWKPKKLQPLSLFAWWFMTGRWQESR